MACWQAGLGGQCILFGAGQGLGRGRVFGCLLRCGLAGGRRGPRVALVLARLGVLAVKLRWRPRLGFTEFADGSVVASCCRRSGPWLLLPGCCGLCVMLATDLIIIFITLLTCSSAGVRPPSNLHDSSAERPRGPAVCQHTERERSQALAASAFFPNWPVRVLTTSARQPQHAGMQPPATHTHTHTYRQSRHAAPPQRTSPGCTRMSPGPSPPVLQPYRQQSRGEGELLKNVWYRTWPDWQWAPPLAFGSRV